MAEEPHRSPAAEIAVTSNGDLDQSPEAVFQRDPYPGGPGALNLSESCVASRNFAATTEGIIESGPHQGSISLPSSPVASVAPSAAAAGRLARSVSDSQADKGTDVDLDNHSLLLTTCRCSHRSPISLLLFSL